MAANLLDNAQKTLNSHKITNCYAWSDSSVVLHWIREKGNYKQFVHNRIQKIKQNTSQN